LTVENVGDSEVFVQAGDIVKGGRQDRVLSVDLLLPPRSGVVPIAAFCVESGRWTARGQEDARQFSTAAAAMPSHDAKLAMRTYMASAAQPSSGAARPYAAEPSRADTGSSQQKIWAMVKATHDVVGYIAAINGKISGGDVYASPGLFRKMWPKLLAASVTEAIGNNDSASADPPSTDQLAAFIKAIESAPESERVLNSNVTVATREGDGSLYAETRRADGAWVHRNYLAK